MSDRIVGPLERLALLGLIEGVRARCRGSETAKGIRNFKLFKQVIIAIYEDSGTQAAEYPPRLYYELDQRYEFIPDQEPCHG